MCVEGADYSPRRQWSLEPVGRSWRPGGSAAAVPLEDIRRGVGAEGGADRGITQIYTTWIGTNTKDVGERRERVHWNKNVEKKTGGLDGYV